jgi:hypothetical protein
MQKRNSLGTNLKMPFSVVLMSLSPMLEQDWGLAINSMYSRTGLVTSIRPPHTAK